MSIKTYDILNEAGEVVNTIIADEEFMQQTYPNSNYAEQAKDQRPIPKILSKQEFRFRFTTAEYSALLLAAKTDTEVQTWVETFNLYTDINLDDGYVVESINMMVSKGIIASHRKDAILSYPGPVPVGTPQ